MLKKLNNLLVFVCGVLIDILSLSKSIGSIVILCFHSLFVRSRLNFLRVWGIKNFSFESIYSELLLFHLIPFVFPRLYIFIKYVSNRYYTNYPCKLLSRMTLLFSRPVISFKPQFLPPPLCKNVWLMIVHEQFSPNQ